MNITKASKKHFKSAARLHAASITTGFLSTLPLPFLATLYKSIARCKGSTVLVALDENNNVCGFVAGAVSVGSMYKKVFLRSAIPLIWYILPHLLSITTVRKLIETAWYGFAKKKSKNEQADNTNSGPSLVTSHSSPSSELLSIAVDSSQRGKGTGKKLITELELFFRQNGVSSYKVVTFSKDNISNTFYARCGFTLHKQFLHHGNLMNEYLKKIDVLVAEGDRC
ncbi:MAG: GNAT family N-acetyltransferase [Fibrobacter sp.]|nr:GNAT family N-acetyltransferase [Fibrobacter sp.]